MRLVVTLLENPVAGPLLAPLLRRDLGVGELRTAEMRVLPTFLPLHPGATAAAADGEVNIGQVLEIMRFVNPANLTGLPAISVPAGYDRSGLPVGLQLVARPWDELTLLRLAFAADGIVARRKPAVYFDPLPEADELRT